MSLIINILLFWSGRIKYLSIPLGYRLYDKQQSKLEIAAALIKDVMPLLGDYQVILLCDWPFGNYMVRNQQVIERYVNLFAIAFAFVQVLLFIASRFYDY